VRRTNAPRVRVDDKQNARYHARRYMQLKNRIYAVKMLILCHQKHYTQLQMQHTHSAHAREIEVSAWRMIYKAYLMSRHAKGRGGHRPEYSCIRQTK